MMLYIFIIFIIISTYKLSIKDINKNDELALTRDRTTMINGFFVGLILFSHFNSYVSLTNNNDKVYLFILTNIGQLMVTTFLFYSGYGIFESLKNKPNYINNFFKNRILKLFISFSFSIILYIILNILLKNNYSIKNVLLSFTGYESIGNSNWFIFATYCIYFIVLLSFKIFKKNKQNALLLCFLLTIVYILIMRKTNHEMHWYNTILCFNLGMYISYNKEKILSLLKNNYNYILIVLILIIMFIACHRHTYNYIVYELYSLIFVLLIFIFSLRIKIKNKLLYFLGKNTFNIYILQRIVYILLNRIKNIRDNVYIYFIISIIVIIILTYIFNKIIHLLYRLFKLA